MTKRSSSSSIFDSLLFLVLSFNFDLTLDLGFGRPVELVVALDGERVGLGVHDPLLEVDEAVVAEQQVEVLQGKKEGGFYAYHKNVSCGRKLLRMLSTRTGKGDNKYSRPVLKLVSHIVANPIYLNIIMYERHGLKYPVPIGFT